MACLSTIPSADETLGAPVSGELVPMADVDDPMFALELLGRSCAIDPSSHLVVSPAAGTVTMLSDTLHAIGITTDCGAELLVHAGIGTVELRGAPFSPRVRVGDHVVTGDPLTEMDPDAIRAAGLSPTVITIVTNSARYARIEVLRGGSVAAGEKLMSLIV